MARYRKIDPRIWNDEKFRTMSHEGQRLFLFVLTHPSLTMIGAMRATQSGLSEELGLDAKAFREAFEEALSKGMLKYDEKAFLLWLPNFLKYNAPESPNVVKSWGSALDLLPECDLRKEVLSSAKAFISTMSKAFAEALPKAFKEALPKAISKTIPNQEQEQEQEQDIRNTKEKPASRKSDDFRATVFPKIVSKYNSILGDKLPRVSAQSDKRIEKCRKWANALYREKGCKSQDELLGEAEKFFRQVLRCPFLLGEAGGDRHWRADFDFLMTEKGRIGVIEGKYLSTGKEASSFYKPVHDWEAEQQAYYEKQREQEMSHAEAVSAYLQGGKA